MSQSRQLAAILFADIQGYTALMQEDEALAIELRNKFKKKLETETEIHQGRILEFRGDGALCCFTSSIEAVNAAIAIQTEMQRDLIVPLRIGLHTGDIISEGNTIYGDGVNIASRIESFAVPGGVFISGKAYDDIKNQKHIQTVSLGKYSLKNVKDPVEIFAIRNPGLTVPVNRKLEGKGIRYVSKKISIDKKTLLIRIGLLVLALAIAGYFLVLPVLKKQHARNKLIPAIEKLVNENFRPPTEAFDLALKAERYLPKDTVLLNLWPVLAQKVTFETKPSGADVFWKDYNDVKGEWKPLGKTPLKD